VALIKIIPTPYGVDATYHNIAALQTYYREGCCDVVLASYLDEPARRSGCQPLGTLPAIRLTLADCGDPTDPSRTTIYAALAALPAWADATSG
jgi:hypothetical protein